MKFTLLHPFFQHNTTLVKQLACWDQWTPEQKKNVEIIIVDDCSPEPIDLGLLRPHKDLNLSVYKVIDDIFWNTPGVKNLGFTVAQADWVIAADMDIICTRDTLTGLWNLDYTDDKNQYWPYLNFPSKNHPERLRHPHVNSYVMNKRVFWELGGYDEDFSGQYGYEDIWFHRVWIDQVHPEKVIKIKLPKVAFRWLRGSPDSSKTSRLDPLRRSNYYLLKDKEESKTRSTEVLRFKWKKIL